MYLCGNIYKTIVTTSSQLVDAHDRVCASIMDECIQIRDRSMLYDVISSQNASEIVNCLAITYIFSVLFLFSFVYLCTIVQNKRYYMQDNNKNDRITQIIQRILITL